MRSISGTIVAVLVLFVLAPRAAPGQKPEAKAAPAVTPPGPKTYVGSEVCQACHEDIFNSFQKNPHKAVDFDKKRGRDNHGCEGCHGPASAHIETVSADEIINPAKLPVARADETCLACHRNQPTHMGRIQSDHARGRVACTSCHTMHQANGGTLVATKAQAVNQQCAGCHPAVWAAFQRPHAHRLAQGAMSCTNCHNPHGSVLPSQIRTFAANEPSCVSCHTDLRGPFTYEHSPMRTEGCQTCHEPHGSANPKMLTRADVRFVCLECHANLPQPTRAAALGVVPPSFHDLRSPRYRNCTICHQKIHGSHVDRNLTR
jgi:DmsE family decaheme c-type cytochrome